MYPEFIIIYFLLFVVIALLIAVLVVTLKSSNSRYGSKSNSNVDFYSMSPIKPNNNFAETQSSVGFDKNVKNSVPAEMTAANAGVVFCTKCAHQYSANDKFCPNCGHSRS